MQKEIPQGFLYQENSELLETLLEEPTLREALEILRRGVLSKEERRMIFVTDNTGMRYRNVRALKCGPVSDRHDHLLIYCRGSIFHRLIARMAPDRFLYMQPYIMETFEALKSGDASVSWVERLEPVIGKPLSCYQALFINSYAANIAIQDKYHLNPMLIRLVAELDHTPIRVARAKLDLQIDVRSRSVRYIRLSHFLKRYLKAAYPGKEYEQHLNPQALALATLDYYQGDPLTWLANVKRGAKQIDITENAVRCKDAAVRCDALQADVEMARVLYYDQKEADSGDLADATVTLNEAESVKSLAEAELDKVSRAEFKIFPLCDWLDQLAEMAPRLGTTAKALITKEVSKHDHIKHILETT